MAEFNMSYAEAKQFVEEATANSDFLMKLRSEILAALTAKEDFDGSGTAVGESVALWENQIQNPSELLLGTRYFVVKDTLLQLLWDAAVSGALESAIKAFLSPENPIGELSFTAAASLVKALIDFFKSVVVLEDWDFCVYLQAVTHFKTHREFTLQDLHQWFPHGEPPRCNMHDSRWACSYLQENDCCRILQEDHLCTALQSLEKKNLLKVTKQPGVYSFRW